MKLFKEVTQLDENRMTVSFEQDALKTVFITGTTTVILYRDLQKAVFYKQVLLIFTKSGNLQFMPFEAVDAQTREQIAALLSERNPAVKMIRRD